MTVEAIEQATCTNCGEEEFDQTKREISSASDDKSYISYAVECDECGEESALSITEEGVISQSEISYEDASWNQDEDEGDDDE